MSDEINSYVVFLYTSGVLVRASVSLKEEEDQIKEQ